MNRFRCKVCGRTYEAVPKICDCGNGSPSLWDIASPDGRPPEALRADPGRSDAPQPPVYAPPASGGPTFPVYPSPAPLSAAPPYAPAPEKRAEAPKAGRAAVAVLSVLLCVLLAGAGVFGYFTYRAFALGENILNGNGEDGGGTGRKKRDAPEETTALTPAPAAFPLPEFSPVNTVTPPNEARLIKLPSFAGTEFDALLHDVFYGNELRFTKAEQGSATVPVGFVISQSLPAGSLVNTGTELVLTVSIGAQKLTMPDVAGKSYEAAAAELSSYRLECEITLLENTGEHTPGTVRETFPPAGTEVTEGDVVTLLVWDEVGQTPTPTPGSGTMYVDGVSMDVPAGFTLTDQSEDLACCEDSSMDILIMMHSCYMNVFDELDAYDSYSAGIRDLFESDDVTLTDYDVFSIDGYQTLYVVLSKPGGDRVEEILFIQISDIRAVEIQFEFFDANNVTAAESRALRDAVSSISVD